ncbi:MAG: hypothetical protein RLY71_1162 [Pseudomonadota bacterium]|jgi:hypothetical protein
MEPADLIEARRNALTEGTADSLSEHPDLFPTVPTNIHELLAALHEVIAISEANGAFERELEAAYDAEMQIMEELGMHALRMAEYLDRLQKLGVIPAELTPPEVPPLPIPLVPGQCMALSAQAHGPDEVALSWQSPEEGSRVHGYEVEKAAAPGGPDGLWQLAVTSLSTQVVLPQPPGVEVMYRVVARGIGGRGLPSEQVGIHLG